MDASNDSRRERALVTRPNRGQWENVVPDQPERSQSFGTREEAVEQGRAVAAELGLEHVVQDDEH